MPGDREEDDVPPSILCLYWRGDETPLEFEVVHRLSAAGYRSSDRDFEVGREVVWAIAFEHEDHDAPFLIWVEERPDQDDPLLYSRARWATEEEMRGARDARWLVYVETLLDREAALPGYQRQLQLAAALGDDLVVACLDVCSFTLRSFLSLRELATSPAAPRPDSLYTIHFVVGEGDAAWLHTHGLARAGCPDLDVLGVPREDAGVAGEVIQAVAAQLLEVPPDGPIATHQFGQGLAVALHPWREVAEDFPPDILGGEDDRDDAYHGGARWILGESDGVAEGRLVPLGPTLDRMADNPILYVTLAATRRMEVLSRERWPQAAMAYYSGASADRRLLVKLGYPVDGSDRDREREHLWFEVQRIGKGTVEARLLNQPYRIARLAVDDVGVHDLALLTDFALHTSRGVYTPETIGEYGNVEVWTDPAEGACRVEGPVSEA